MRRTVILAIWVLAFCLLFGAAEAAGAVPMGTAWTYQGRLLDANDTADGAYDLEFRLFDDPCTGKQQGGTVALDNLDVIDGYFTVLLDFGGVFDGDARWLEIAVRPGASVDGNDFVTLIPRQETTPTPYAIYAQTAEDADTVDGLEAGDFAIRLHAHRGEDITAGTVGTDFYSAIQDLFAEGYLGNNTGDVAQNNSTLQKSLNADMLDGLDESAFFRLAQNETVTGRPSFDGGTSGTYPPFYVDSTSLVYNLNADLLDGVHGSNFFHLSENETVSGIPSFNGGVPGSTPPFYVSSTTLVGGLNADYLDGQSEGSFFRLAQNEAVTGRPSFNGGVSGSTPPFYVDSTLKVTNLNADYLDGLHSTAFATSGHTHNYDATYVNVIGDTMTGSLNVSSSPAAYAVQGIGDNGPTNGYLGVQGIDSYEGITSTYWAGWEIGVAGISTGSTATDNYGVLGHASYAGVRGEYSGDPNNYGQIGSNGVGLSAYASRPSGVTYGVYTISTNYGTSAAYGAYNKSLHEGTSGTTYGTYSQAYGSDTGTAYGTISAAYKESSDTSGTAYGGYFTGDNDYNAGNSYGVYARAIGTGGTNYGVFGYAANGTTNYAGYFSGGKNYFSGDVGIGTTTPDYKLEVNGSMGTSADASSKLRVGRYSSGSPNSYISATGGAESMRLQIADSTKMTITSSGSVGIGTDSPTERLTIRGGNLLIERSDGTDVVELGEGLDYAEGFDVSASTKIDAGSVLIIDADNPGKLALSNKAYDTKVAGIVAGANGIGSGVRLGAGDFDHDVALAGRVYCKVDATENGVEAGDLLTTSATAGYAMKSTDYMRAQGAILGKAMESIEKGQKGQILVLVTLQ